MIKPWEVAILIERFGIRGAICPILFDAKVINTQKQYERTGINQYVAEYINRYVFRSLLERWKHWEFRVPSPRAYLAQHIPLDLMPISVEARLNKIVDAALTKVGKTINGNVTTGLAYTFNAIGTSSQAPAAGDTDLIAPISPRKAIGEAFEDGFTALMQVLYGETENNSASLVVESGFFSALTGATMLNRQTFTGVDHSLAANTALTILAAILVSE